MQIIAGVLMFIWLVAMLLYVSGIYRQLQRLNQMLAASQAAFNELHHIAVKHDRRSSGRECEFTPPEG